MNVYVITLGYCVGVLAYEYVQKDNNSEDKINPKRLFDEAILEWEFASLTERSPSPTSRKQD